MDNFSWARESDSCWLLFSLPSSRPVSLLVLSIAGVIDLPLTADKYFVIIKRNVISILKNREHFFYEGNITSIISKFNCPASRRGEWLRMLSGGEQRCAVKNIFLQHFRVYEGFLMEATMFVPRRKCEKNVMEFACIKFEFEFRWIWRVLETCCRCLWTLRLRMCWRVWRERHKFACSFQDYDDEDVDNDDEESPMLGRFSSQILETTPSCLVIAAHSETA